MSEEKKVLEVVAETEILGRRIQMYGNIESPLFLAKNVAEWIDYSKSNGKYKLSQMTNTVDDDEKGVYNVATQGGIQESVFLTEDGLYEVCMLSRKPIAKTMRKAIKAYLKSIRITGAAIQPGRESEMIDKYFPSFSEETKEQMVKDLLEKNQELTQFYNDLINTDGLMDMNSVGKELKIGEYALFQFLRDKKVFFYNKDRVNLPYERFRKENKFAVKEVVCRDGRYRTVTYATRKGLDYIRKLLHKDGYYTVTE